MNKLSLGIATLLLSTTFLAACGNQEQEPTNANIPASNPAESNSPGLDSTTGTENNSTTLSSTNNIKWDDVKDPLIDEALKDKLKASVNAIVNKDVEAFHKTLGPNVGTAHDYLLDNPVKFTDVGEVHEEGGRVLVPVKGENQSKGNASEIAYTFYFEKDISGEWQIVSID